MVARDFKGIWIPREIWELEDLGWNEKLLLVEVDSLNIDGQGCYASNDYLAKFLGVSKERLRKIIYRLVKDGYLTSKLIYKPGTNEVEKRLLWPSTLWAEKTKPSGQEQPDPPGENDQTPLGENDQTLGSKMTTRDTRLRNKVKDTNIENKREKTTPSEIVKMYHSICSSLPKIVKLTDGRKTAIKARMEEYGVDQIEKTFRMAEASDFLKGVNDREWKADFDWLMKSGNMAKVLEGNYVNKFSNKNKKSTHGEDIPDRYSNIEQEETL